MLVGLLAINLLAGCVSPAVGQSGSTSPVSASSNATVSSGATVADVSDDYRLGVADKIRLLVFDEPSLSGEFAVNANGSLSLPLIGDVPAVGVTPTAAAETIRTKLADGFLKEPRVSIDVLTFRPFYILGEVNKPGEYPYSAGLTVLNAVATAQGFTYRANKKKVIIKNAGADHEQVENLNVDLKVRPGDTIRIKERLF